MKLCTGFRFRLYRDVLTAFLLSASWLCLADKQPVVPAKSADHPRLERLPNGDMKLGTLVLSPTTRELSFPAKFVLGRGVLEVVVATPTGRLHETLLVADVSPLQIQSLLYVLHYNNGPRLTDSTGRPGDLIDIFIEWITAEGKTVREPVEKWMLDLRTGQAMIPKGWVFVGSTIREGKFLADLEGNVVINYSVGSTILDIPDAQGTDDTIFEVNADKKQPKKGAAVRLIFAPHNQ